MVNALQENNIYLKREMENIPFEIRYRVSDDTFHNERVLNLLRTAFLDSIICSRGSTTTKPLIWACVYATPASSSFIPTEN